MEEPSKFFSALFDFSFTEFITTKLIKVLYGIGIVISGLSALSWIVSGFAGSFGKGLLFLILSPIVFIIGVILTRVWLEIIIVVFKIAENVGKIADSK